MNVKRKLDKSRIKKMIFEIGCFMDLYNLMIENNDQIVNRFLTYFYYLNENSSVLSMKHGVNGDTLLDIAKNLGDNLITYKTLSRYVQEDETFNEKFEEYAFYFNERCDALRRLGQVNPFFFLFCFVLSPRTVWFWFTCFVRTKNLIF